MARGRLRLPSVEHRVHRHHLREVLLVVLLRPPEVLGRLDGRVAAPLLARLDELGPHGLGDFALRLVVVEDGGAVLARRDARRVFLPELGEDVLERQRVVELDEDGLRVVADLFVRGLEEVAAGIPHNGLLDAFGGVERPLRVPESSHRERRDLRRLVEGEFRRNVERARRQRGRGGRDGEKTVQHFEGRGPLDGALRYSLICECARRQISVAALVS
mmetsp:Transcript_5772/g.17033  ORF Transcript_5772/g.17033 Transcript_5772/m.17033 type:complete len:217 (+) Transcript_5772:93-743(+)